MKRIARHLRDLEKSVEPEVGCVPVLTLSVRNPDGTVEPPQEARQALGLPARKSNVRRRVLRP